MGLCMRGWEWDCVREAGNGTVYERLGMGLCERGWEWDCVSEAGNGTV